jgi:hypothetical protein
MLSSIAIFSVLSDAVQQALLSLTQVTTYTIRVRVTVCHSEHSEEPTGHGVHTLTRLFARDHDWGLIGCLIDIVKCRTLCGISQDDRLAWFMAAIT